MKHEHLARILSEIGYEGFYYHYPFHPVRRWTLTFAWPQERIGLIVLDHHLKVNPEHLTEAALDGWIVLPVAGSMLTPGRLRFYLRRAFRIRKEGLYGPQEADEAGAEAGCA